MKKLLITVLFVLCFIGQVACEQGHQKGCTVTGKDLVAFIHNDKIGFKNSSGKVVINPRFDSVHLFSEGLAAVEVEDQWGYIDKSGSYIIEPVFDDARSFCDGRAMVKFAGRWGWVDRSGKLCITPYNKTISHLESSSEIVSSSDLEWLAISDARFPKKLTLTPEVKEMMASKCLSNPKFITADLNEDRIPEIIIDNPDASGSAGATFDIFAWKKGKWSRIGRVQGGFSIDFNNLCEERLNEYALISSWPRLGDYYIELWKFSNGAYRSVSIQRLPGEITANLAWEYHWGKMNMAPDCP